MKRLNDKKRKKKISKGDVIFCISLLLLPTLQFIIFYIGTNFNSFALAFKRYDLGDFVYDGWTNFAKVFSDIVSNPEVISAIKNSFIVYFVGLIVSMPLSILFSYYIFKNFFGSKVFKILLFLPSILSALMLCVLYRYFVDQALPEIMLKLFGVKMLGLFANMDTEYVALMIAQILFNFGTSMLLYLGAMSDINVSVLEASKIDGANNWQQFVNIILPMITPTMKTFFICGLAGLFTNQFNLFNFYGLGANTEYETIGYYFYKLTLMGESNYPYVAAFGLVISLILIPITLGLNSLLNKVQNKIM